MLQEAEEENKMQGFVGQAFCVFEPLPCHGVWALKSRICKRCLDGKQASLLPLLVMSFAEDPRET